MTTVCRIYGFFKIRFTRIVLHPNQTQWTSYHWKATTTTHGSTPGDCTSGSVETGYLTLTLALGQHKLQEA